MSEAAFVQKCLCHTKSLLNEIGFVAINTAYAVLMHQLYNRTFDTHKLINNSMKKIILANIALLASLCLHAQVEVSTKSFELESQNKHKGWSILDAGRDENNQIYVKFSQPVCDVTRSAWTGTSTYKGLKWNIDKLIFDNEFNFQKTETKNYTSSEEALLNNEYVFGKTFMPVMAGGVGGALLSGAGLPSKPISNAYMFTNIIVPTVSITGFKIITSGIGCQPLATDTKTKGTLCGEIPVAETISSVDAKEQKGQRWIPMYNNPVPNGGNILFNTVGVSADPNVQYYVFRKYDKSGNVTKEKTFSFDYQCLPTVKEIEKTPGVFDYVFIMATINYKKSKLRVAPANQYEYIKVDGETFDIKEQFTFTAPFSQWLVGYAIEADGAIYLAGVAGEKNTIYLDFSVPKTDDYPNFQVIKIASGKLVFATATTTSQTQAANKTIEGLKSKAPFHYHLKDVQLFVKNGRLIISGQQEIAAIRGSMVTAVFAATGELEAFIAKTEKVFSRGRISFNTDGSKLFWLLEDFSEYNDVIGVNALNPKKAKQPISALTVLTYGVNEKQLIKNQPLINEEWAVNYKNPVLYESDSELLLLGNKITKKAKESEVVFITIKK